MPGLWEKTSNRDRNYSRNWGMLEVFRKKLPLVDDKHSKSLYVFTYRNSFIRQRELSSILKEWVLSREYPYGIFLTFLSKIFLSIICDYNIFFTKKKKKNNTTHSAKKFTALLVNVLWLRKMTLVQFFFSFDEGCNQSSWILSFPPHLPFAICISVPHGNCKHLTSIVQRACGGTCPGRLC